MCEHKWTKEKLAELDARAEELKRQARIPRPENTDIGMPISEFAPGLCHLFEDIQADADRRSGLHGCIPGGNPFRGYPGSS